MAEDDRLFVRKQLVRIDQMMAETRSIKTRTFPAWLFIFGIVLAVGLASPLTIPVLDRVWPMESERGEVRMTNPIDNAFIARRLREMQNQSREHFHILRAEIVRVQEAIERSTGAWRASKVSF